jgi:hypothetical protein
MDAEPSDTGPNDAAPIDTGLDASTLPTLLIAFEGTGGGTALVNGTAVCRAPYTCTQPYVAGTRITIDVSNDPLSSGTIQSGPFSCAGVTSCNFTLDSDVAITVAFSLALQAAPPPRTGHTAVYASINDRMIVFGGEDASGQPSDHLYYFPSPSTPFSVVSELVPPNGPLPRYRASAVYASTTDKMIVFGGWDGVQDTDEVWVLDDASASSASPSWRLLATGGVRPPGTSGHVAAYDEQLDAMIVFGGTSTRTFVLKNALAPSLAFWAELATQGTSPEPLGASAGYDMVNERLVIYGGTNGAGGNNQLYEIFPFSWTPTWTPVGAPANRQATTSQAGAWDQHGQRLFVFGGIGSSFSTDPVFSFAFGTMPEWIPFSAPIGTPATPRLGASGIYVANTMTFVIFGGTGPIGVFSDLHAFDASTNTGVWHP